MRNCFAHFREVINGHQVFGINTKVRAAVVPPHEKALFQRFVSPGEGFVSSES
jgi:hypothetical protein